MYNFYSGTLINSVHVKVSEKNEGIMLAIVIIIFIQCAIIRDCYTFSLSSTWAITDRID